MQMLWTIKVQSFFRRALGITSGDIRSFQLCKTNSGYYHTVYLKDLPETDARSSVQTAWGPPRTPTIFPWFCDYAASSLTVTGGS
jgi:hypothetical protein